MIGQHPETMGLPELKLFSYDTIGELDASLPQYWIERGMKHRSPGLVRAIAQFQFGSQEWPQIEAARAWLREREEWTGAAIFDHLMQRLTPRITVEKSPENVESEASLGKLVAAYPRARYLHLTRHPVSTQRSLEEHWNRTIPDHRQEGQPMAGVYLWVETHSRILRLAESLPKERYLRVRAEDVLNDRCSQLRSIAEWLQLRTDDAAIRAMLHPEESPFARFGIEGSGILGGHDPKFMADPIPRRVPTPGAVERPTGWVDYAELWNTAVDIASLLGYS